MEPASSVKIEPRGGCEIWLEYEDGVSDEIDLSDVAEQPVFRTSAGSPLLFEQVHVAPYNIPSPRAMTSSGDPAYFAPNSRG